MAVRHRSSLLRYLALVTLVGVCILVLVELVAWVFSPGRFADPPAVTADAWISSDALAPADTVWLKEFVDEFCLSYHAHWSSYVYYRRHPFSGKHINIDTNGIRSTVPWGLRHAENGSPARVMLFGGSTMWGTGSRDSGTIPSALARLIGSDAGVRPAAVVNMGESGYVSTQSILALELELRRGNVPDIVILYDGVNDIYSAFQNGEPGLPQNEGNREAEFNLLKDGGRMRRLGIHDFFGRTVTASILQRVRSAISSPPPAPAPRAGLAEDIVRLYRGNLEIIEALSRQFGFRYEAYWQPVVFTRAEPSRYEQRQSDLQQQVRPLFLEVYSRVAQDSTLRHNPHFHNISGVFDATGIPLYLDFCHISETGNAIIARRMYTDIRRSLLVPTAPVN
jgi:lysophospholipase L1-like esterase